MKYADSFLFCNYLNINRIFNSQSFFFIFLSLVCFVFFSWFFFFIKLIFLCLPLHLVSSSIAGLRSLSRSCSAQQCFLVVLTLHLRTAADYSVICCLQLVRSFNFNLCIVRARVCVLVYVFLKCPIIFIRWRLQLSIVRIERVDQCYRHPGPCLSLVVHCTLFVSPQCK